MVFISSPPISLTKRTSGCNLLHRRCDRYDFLNTLPPTSGAMIPAPDPVKKTRSRPGVKAVLALPGGSENAELFQPVWCCAARRPGKSLRRTADARTYLHVVLPTSMPQICAHRAGLQLLRRLDFHHARVHASTAAICTKFPSDIEDSSRSGHFQFTKTRIPSNLFDPESARSESMSARTRA